MKNFLILIFVYFFIVSIHAQDAIKRVIVETYYISDAKDATDTTGGYLEPGSVTYRIYVQMKPGCKLQKIFASEMHPLIIESTSNFFNNKDYGKSLAKEINKNSLQHNTVALDTWLTIGQTTKSNTETYFGILKSQDTSGSFIGGINNDGGSEEIDNGLLTNANSDAGRPLTEADGMDTLINLPSNWSEFGLGDSTIFGNEKPASVFISNNAVVSNSGVIGINPDSNQVLIAQLTTKGQISFNLNLGIVESDGLSTLYVANGADSAGIKVNPWLKYPWDCGCNDPDYLEYSNKYICKNSDSCKTHIILGCMDINACNYDPKANVNLQSLCCYPGDCSDRDIELVCPDLVSQPLNISVYPNPARDEIRIQTSAIDGKETKYIIFNSYGEIVFIKDLGQVTGEFTDNLVISDFKTGLYLIRLIAGHSGTSILFTKD